MDKLFGFLAPTIIYTFIFLLNLLLPGRWVVGYATKINSDEKLNYRLNGIWVLFILIFCWFLLGYSGLLPWDWLYLYRWYALSGAICLGIAFSLAVVLPFPAVTNSFLTDFFLGRAENLQLWGGKIDAKMWLYLVGAILLELNILSFTAHHALVYGSEASVG
ncbi:MAG: hypothetical protein RI894_1727, partial [Bacteroidota bacterium]